MAKKRIVVWVQHRADRPYLCLEWHDPDTGQRKKRSAETNNPMEAETKRADLEYELNNGLAQERSKLDWDHFHEIFQDEYLPGLRERTREKYNVVLDVFEQTINPTKLRTVTERTISLFVKALRERDPFACKRNKKRKNPRKRKRKEVVTGRIGLAPITIRNYLIALKTALAWAANQKLIPAVPKFPAIKVPKKKPQPIPAEAFEKLLEKAPDARWRAYLMSAGGPACGSRKPGNSNGIQRMRFLGWTWTATGSFCRRSLPRVQKTNGFRYTRFSGRPWRNYRGQAKRCFRSSPARAGGLYPETGSRTAFLGWRSRRG